MKFLVIGIWEDGEDGCPQFESLPTESIGDQDDDVADCVKRIRRKACRRTDPARVLVIEDRSGPKLKYQWRVGYEYGACRFTDPRGPKVEVPL